MKAADLRKSILQAALQGRLVPQDKNDEPASELLKRIQEEKAKLIKEGKLKKEKSLMPITKDEIPYDLPEGWVWCRLGNAVTIKSSKRIYESDYVREGIPFYRSKEIGDLSRGESITTKFYITAEKYMEIKKQFGVPQKGDILVTSVGTIGNCWVCDGRDFYYKDGNITQILATENISENYLLLYLRSPLFFLQALGTVAGTAYGALTIIKFNNVIFPIPPLAEQQRIVAKVDELMAMCDELEATEKELDALESHFFDYLPKSILQAAVQSKLVPQDKNDEPATELLKRIQAEKAKLIKEGKLKKEKSLPPIAEDEIPYDLSEGWVWCHIGNIVITNPRNSLADDTMVTFLPMSLISQDYFGGHKQDTKLWKEVKSGFTHFAEGDVLLAKITPCFQNGKSCIAHNLCSGYGAGTTELHVLRSILVDSRYLLLFLKCPIFIKAAEINMTGTAGQQRVPTDYLRRFLFPLPPFAEQQRIVAKVDELMTLCDELKCVDKQPIDHCNVISFPTKTEPDDAEPIKMAAQGKVAAQPSKQHTAALDDLLGMMNDD